MNYDSPFIIDQINMEDYWGSREVDSMIDFQNSKVMLPRLQAKRGGSLPTYGRLKSGGDCLYRPKAN